MIKSIVLSSDEQAEYYALVDELLAKGGPTIGQLKKCAEKAPEKVARLIELGWINPADEGAPATGGVSFVQSGDDEEIDIERETCDDTCEFFEDDICLLMPERNCNLSTLIDHAESIALNKDIIESLAVAGITDVSPAKAVDICNVINEIYDAKPEGEVPIGPVFVHIENRVKKRNVFLADSVRNENDIRFLNKEINQRKYKSKIASITTIKHCDVSADGEWVTEFDIELKE